MYETAVIGTVVLMVVSAVDYVRRAWIRETNPVLATWILLMVMMGLSFGMYWASPRRSWTSNIAVTTGVVNVAIILAGVIATNVRNGTLHLEFDRVQRACLAGGAVVVVFWLLTDRPLVAYALVQAIALIAYIATVRRLWVAERSMEPLFLWVAVLCANLCSIYPAWVKHDPFAWIYLARAVPSTILVIWLITRIKRRMQDAATATQE